MLLVNILNQIIELKDFAIEAIENQDYTKYFLVQMQTLNLKHKLSKLVVKNHEEQIKEVVIVLLILTNNFNISNLEKKEEVISYWNKLTKKIDNYLINMENLSIHEKFLHEAAENLCLYAQNRALSSYQVFLRLSELPAYHNFHKHRDEIITIVKDYRSKFNNLEVHARKLLDFI
jgi:hypothetical protein